MVGMELAVVLLALVVVLLRWLGSAKYIVSNATVARLTHGLPRARYAGEYVLYLYICFLRSSIPTVLCSKCTTVRNIAMCIVQL